MSKLKLIFTGYKEEWSEFVVHVNVTAIMNNVPIEFESLPMSHKRATTEVVERVAKEGIQDVIEQAIKRLGIQPSDYDRDLGAMVKDLDVYLHQTFRDQCTENEIPFDHLVKAVEAAS